MFKKLILLAFPLLFTISTQAQQGEFGLNLYSAHYIGDLRENLQARNGFGDFMSYAFELMRPGAGVYGRYNFNPRLSAKGSINWARLYGADNLANESSNQIRNLSFRTDILEFSGQMEWNFRPFGWSRSSLGEKRFTPFVFGGVSLFRFNPKAEYTNSLNGDVEWVELQPLSTEGQDLIFYPSRSRYSLTQFSFPVGLGLKYAFEQNWRLGFEVGYRFTFTDYLDDVSGTYVSNDILLANRGQKAADLADRRQEINPALPKAAEGAIRGDASNNDAYLFIGFTIGYTIYKSTCPQWY